jgi:5'-3' exoribonuclease 1
VHDLKRVQYLIKCFTAPAAALPTLDIAEGALDKIFAIYKELLPVMGGYLTEAGQLNRRRLQLLLDRLSQLEQETLELRAQASAK